MRPGEPNRTRHREVYGAACFFGGVASPVSIKASSWHALDQLLNCTSHMPCIWGMVNRRSLQHHRVGSGVGLTGWISPFFWGQGLWACWKQPVSNRAQVSEDSILGWDATVIISVWASERLPCGTPESAHPSCDLGFTLQGCDTIIIAQILFSLGEPITHKSQDRNLTCI